MKAAKAFAAAACAILVAACSASSDGTFHSGPTPPTNAVAVARPDIARLSESMVVGEKSFPIVRGADWRPPYVEAASNDGASTPEVVPRECTPIVHGWAHGQHGYAAAMLKSGGLSYKAELTMPSQVTHIDIATLTPTCGTITRGNQIYQVRRESIADLPPWATALRIDTLGHQVLGIFGRCRGVDMAVYVRQEPTVSPEDIAADTALFNAQVAKLQAV
jgi:hypothetical protein